MSEPSAEPNPAPLRGGAVAHGAAEDIEGLFCRMAARVTVSPWVLRPRACPYATSPAALVTDPDERQRERERERETHMADDTRSQLAVGEFRFPRPPAPAREQPGEDEREARQESGALHGTSI